MKITEIINKYCEEKEKEKALKKVLGTLSTDIKDYMAEHADEDISTDDFTVHIQLKVSEEVDEEGMLEVLKKDWASKYGSMQCPYIKTREYVDMDALEQVIYAGGIATEVLLQLDKCRTVKETRALTYKKVKKEA